IEQFQVQRIVLVQQAIRRQLTGFEWNALELDTKRVGGVRRHQVHGWQWKLDAEFGVQLVAQHLEALLEGMQRNALSKARPDPEQDATVLRHRRCFRRRRRFVGLAAITRHHLLGYLALFSTSDKEGDT